jgi:hypothetical protein
MSEHFHNPIEKQKIPQCRNISIIQKKNKKYHNLDNRVMLKKRNHFVKMILPDDVMKSLLQTFYRRHLDLVDHLEISISQMTKDLFQDTVWRQQETVRRQQDTVRRQQETVRKQQDTVRRQQNTKTHHNTCYRHSTAVISIWLTI